MSKVSEKHFGSIFVSALRACGFETWQEVDTFGGVIDVVGKYNGIYYIFELKSAMNDDLLEQVMRRGQHFKDCFCFAVIPYSSEPITKYRTSANWTTYTISFVKEFFAEHFGFGVLTFDYGGYGALQAQLIKHQYEYSPSYGTHSFNFKSVDYSNGANYLLRTIVQAKKSIGGHYSIEEFLYDDQKDSCAGSKAGGAITPFKRSCRLILEYLKEHKGVTRKELWKALDGKLHWASYGSMCSCFRNRDTIPVIKEILDLMKND